MTKLMDAPTDTTLTGRKQRDVMLDVLQAARFETIHACRLAMIKLYRERIERMGANIACVSGDDASQWLDAQGCGHDYRLIGAVFRPKTGWVGVGYAPSLLPRRHARPIRLWRWAGQSE